MKIFCIVITLVVMLCLSETNALACTCIRAVRTLATEYLNRGAVVGTVTEISNSTELQGLAKTVKVNVEESFGVGRKGVVTYTVAPSSFCGYNFEEGRKYLIFNETFCSRNWDLTNPSSDLHFLRSLAISEDFKSSEALSVIKGGKWEIKEGTYLLTNPAKDQNGNGNISIHEKILKGDFSLIASLGIPDADGEASIIFGLVDAKNYHYINLSRASNDNKRSGIFSVRDGIVTELLDFVTPEIQSASIEIELKGNEISAYIYEPGWSGFSPRKLLGSVTDSSIRAGKVGVGSLSSQAEFHHLLAADFSSTKNGIEVSATNGQIGCSGTITPIKLSWVTTVEGPTFTLKRSTTKGGPYDTVVADYTLTSFEDYVPQGTYYYTVTAVKGSAEVLTSNEITAKSTPASCNPPPPAEKPTPDKSNLISEDFTKGSSRFSSSAGSWKTQYGEYHQTSQSTDKTLSLHEKVISGDFTLSVDLMVQNTQSRADNASIIFGYKDEQNYFFVSLSEKKSSSSHGVFSVVNGRMTKVGELKSAIKTGRWYSLKITRTGRLLTVSVAGKGADNRSTVVEVKDIEVGKGKVGFSTRRSRARFDNLLVSST
jgi:hypothetical protein